MNYKLQILIFGYTYSSLKFEGGECGEYGLVLWASWLSTEKKFHLHTTKQNITADTLLKQRILQKQINTYHEIAVL